MDKLLTELKNESNRKANFKTVIALNLNGKQNLFTGIINGKIIEEKIGTNGFGYDPIFVAEGFDKTFAELSMKEKSTISHRGIAVKELILFLQKLSQ
jgi:XTP/dITP diphosphohydrolase